MTSIRTRSRGRRFRLRFAAGSAWILLAVSPISALAQGFGPDPFRPFNSQYDSYVYPIAPGPLDPVGNPGLNRPGVRGANQFENYINGMGSGNVGTRFDQLYRSQISGRRQAFNPTRDADAKFEDQQSSLTDLYFKYLRERDPAKRAALLKRYTKARNESTRELAGAGRSASGRKPQKPNRDAAGVEDDRPRAGDEEAVDDAAVDDKPERIISPPRRTGNGAAGAGAGPRAKKRGDAPAPPPISGSGSTTRTRERKPSDVLDRANRSEAAGSRRSGTAPPPPPITP